MLSSRALGLSARATRCAADVWRIRERTEREVSAIFARLSADLEASGAPQELTRRARKCAADELVHAVHCQKIVEALDPGRAPLRPDLAIALGPSDPSPARRALYASVALGCITESLSTALLIVMRKAAEAPEVRDGLDVILRDEVEHSRLGWAHLALAAEDGDVAWLAPHVPAMLRGALETPPPNEALDDDERTSLRGWGILPAAEVLAIVESTIATTIAPGLAQFGVKI